MALSILYLHGVGQKVRTDEWYEALAAGLDAHGLAPIALDSPRLVVPDYVDLLRNPPDPSAALTFPEETPRPRRDREEHAAVVADYQRRQAQTVRHLPDPPAAAGLARLGRRLPNTERLVSLLPGDSPEAVTYLRNAPLRAAIIRRVLDQLGTREDLVVLAHSLGSIIAIDLLGHLPSAVRVDLLLTLGSPAGHLAVRGHNPARRLHSYFPYDQVRTWVNVLSPLDPVTGSVGLAREFPAATDVRVMLPAGRHSTRHYLGHPTVRRLLAAPFEQSAPAPVPTGARPEVAPTAEEELMLGTLAYAHQVARHLRPGSRQRRFREALRTVQAEVVDALVSLRLEERRPVPARLVELLDGTAEPTAGPLELERAVTFLVVTATANPVAPFEIDLGDASLKAVVDTWVDLGFTRDGGTLLADSIREAASVFDRSSPGRHATGAVDLAALAAGPLGSMVGSSAGPGTTPSLVAVGPGATLAGLLLAGSLLGVSAATASTALAIGLASSYTPQMLQTDVVRRMAVALASRRLGLEVDDAGWLLLTEWHSRLAMDLERVELLSDEDAPSVRALRRKQRIVAKAVAWMTEQDLAPLLPPPADG